MANIQASIDFTSEDEVKRFFPPPSIVQHRFLHPSSSELKRMCRIAGIAYNHGAYQLWAQFNFERYPTYATNLRLMNNPSASIMNLISSLLTGNQDSHTRIYTAIYNRFTADLVERGMQQIHAFLQFVAEVYDERY